MFLRSKWPRRRIELESVAVKNGGFARTSWNSEYYRGRRARYRWLHFSMGRSASSPTGWPSANNNRTSVNSNESFPGRNDTLRRGLLQSTRGIYHILSGNSHYFVKGGRMIQSTIVLFGYLEGEWIILWRIKSACVYSKKGNKHELHRTVKWRCSTIVNVVCIPKEKRTETDVFRVGNFARMQIRTRKSE